MSTKLLTQADTSALLNMPQNDVNIAVSQMTALMNAFAGEKQNIDCMITMLEKQPWYKRMWFTISGKNKATVAEIQKSKDKITAYTSESVAILYKNNRIQQDQIITLGNMINYVNNQLKVTNYELLKTQESFAEFKDEIYDTFGKLANNINERMTSNDNYHMLMEEISIGKYNCGNITATIFMIIAQIDKRMAEEERKMQDIQANLENKGYLSDEEQTLTEYMKAVANIPNEYIGTVYCDLSCYNGNDYAQMFCELIETYSMLPKMERKAKKLDVIIANIMAAHDTDSNATFSTNEIYEYFIEGKREYLLSINEDVIQSEYNCGGKDYRESKHYDGYDERDASSETFNSNTKADISFASKGEKKALESVISILSNDPRSYNSLITTLENSGFTHSEAVYGVNNCGADWNEQARKSVAKYLEYKRGIFHFPKNNRYSRDGLIKEMEEYGFTKSEAEYGVDNCGADWDEQAKKCVANWLELKCSYNGLIKAMEEDGFTHSEAVYEANNCGADWNEQAKRKAVDHLEFFDSDSRKDLIESLENAGFTHFEAVYGANNCIEDWNEQAKKYAASYLEVTCVSRDEMTAELEKGGFTHLEAVYGADNCGADWYEQAKRGATNLLECDITLSREELIEELENGGFTHSEAVYGTDNCGADWSEQAKREAENLIECDYIDYTQPKPFVKEIIDEYIHKLTKDSSLNPSYNSQEICSIPGKVLKARQKYACGATGDIIGLIDISIFKNGSSGVLFTTDGFAFSNLWSKYFIRYDEIVWFDISDSLKNGALLLKIDFKKSTGTDAVPYFDGVIYDLERFQEMLLRITIECI